MDALEKMLEAGAEMRKLEKHITSLMEQHRTMLDALLEIAARPEDGQRIADAALIAVGRSAQRQVAGSQ